MPKRAVAVVCVSLSLLLSGCSSQPSDELDGKRVAILIGPGMYSTGAKEPAAYLGARGATVVFIAGSPGPVTPYDTPGQPIQVDRLVSDMNADDFDALVIPGGLAALPFGDSLAQVPEIIRLIGDMVYGDQIVAAVCSGVQVLISTDLVADRRVTGVEALHRQAVEGLGGTWVERQEVVRDGNPITCRPTDYLLPFCAAIRDALKGAD